ncbi:MAG: serine-type D-Ala-D-Ala carboxypeptidase [Gammaproteobacteria bacterium RIFCSPHIGHO2_12_FULL_42_10]|nr:MAG: serine-type D-Ala-D-Ala carboxypeptidase [Gammaproteobacteria bacterium RIFCSPHIGHO2_12_FULL_42_10]
MLFFAQFAIANPIIPIQSARAFSTVTPTAPNLGATSYILMDAASGHILASKNADVKNPPASLTKLMSLYVVSAALKSGQIHMDDPVLISTKAWKTEGSRMFVKAGDNVPLKDLLQGSMIASGNDATVALAEYIAGSEDTFTAMMNQTAQRLGMINSHFMDSTGLPNKDHYMSAHDLAILTRAYIDTFPEDYHFYSEKWFSYHGIRQPNRNRLLWRFPDADGLKTGHTNDAGYCLVGSAKKNGVRLISVIMGEPNDTARTEDSIRLLTYGFRFFETHKAYQAATPVIEIRVWGGDKMNMPLGVTKDFYVTVPAGQYKRLQASVHLNRTMKAPIVKGESYGNLNLTLNNEIVASQQLVALDNSQPGGLIRKATDSISYYIHRAFAQSNEKANRG